MRSEQVTQNRRTELEEIKRYVDHDGCLMEFLASALDDPVPVPCGKCMNCARQTKRQPVPAELIHSAVEFLRGDSVLIEARRQWPSTAIVELQRAMPAAVGMTKRGKAGIKIPRDLRAERGRALCIYGDAGWGRKVAQCKYGGGHISDELVRAAAALIRDGWQPDPFPEWIACVPSNRQPILVSDFARRLAVTLNLSFQPVIEKVRDTEPQKLMENSAQQVRNLLQAFSVKRDILSAPVILVDDVIDSGWTATMIAALLRINGSGPVFPFALAKATAGDS